MITNVWVGLGVAVYRWSFLVVPDMPYRYLIGMDIIPSHRISFNWQRNQVQIYAHPSQLLPGARLQRVGSRFTHSQWVTVYTDVRQVEMPSRLLAGTRSK